MISSKESTNRLKQTHSSQNESGIFLQDDKAHGHDKNRLVKSRPKSYRNFSRVAEFMNDFPEEVKENKAINYRNKIQNISKQYIVPSRKTLTASTQEHKFDEFMSENHGRMYKPVDMFSDYSDAMQKNSQLLRRGQFNTPLGKEDFSIFKRTAKSRSAMTKSIRYETIQPQTKYSVPFHTNSSNLKLGNTISQSFQNSIREKKSVRKESQNYFQKKRSKRGFNMSQTSYEKAEQFEQLVGKYRSPQDQVALQNAMNRMLTLEMIGKSQKNTFGLEA